MITITLCQSDEQLKALEVLAKDIWNEYYVSITSQEQVDYMLEKFQSYEAIKKAINEEGYVYYVAYNDGQMVGYCGIRPEGNRLFLSKLYVHKSARGKHISTEFFAVMDRFAKEHKLDKIYLTCNKYNDDSLALYAHKGFQVIDALESDIGNGLIMDDYILEKEVTQ